MVVAVAAEAKTAKARRGNCILCSIIKVQIE